MKARVSEGGHNIPDEIIERRYFGGLSNLFNIYLPIVNKWIIVDNSTENFEFIAEGTNSELIIRNKNRWLQLKEKYNER